MYRKIIFYLPGCQSSTELLIFQKAVPGNVYISKDIIICSNEVRLRKVTVMVLLEWLLLMHYFKNSLNNNSWQKSFINTSMVNDINFKMQFKRAIVKLSKCWKSSLILHSLKGFKFLYYFLRGRNI